VHRLRRRLPTFRIRNTRSHRREAGRADAVRHLDSCRHRTPAAIAATSPSCSSQASLMARRPHHAQTVTRRSSGPPAPLRDCAPRRMTPLSLLHGCFGRRARQSASRPPRRSARWTYPAAPLRELQVPAMRCMAPRAGDWLHAPRAGAPPVRKEGVGRASPQASAEYEAQVVQGDKPGLCSGRTPRTGSSAPSFYLLRLRAKPSPHRGPCPQARPSDRPTSCGALPLLTSLDALEAQVSFLVAFCQVMLRKV
jgi:hypothetical protein